MYFCYVLQIKTLLSSAFYLFCIQLYDFNFGLYVNQGLIYYCILIGFFGVVWTFVLRKYALALERRKTVITSVPSKLHSSLHVKDKIPVPWMKLFQRFEFW
jgi:hypothetical protein